MTNEQIAKALRDQAELALQLASECEKGLRAHNTSSFTLVDCDEELKALMLANKRLIKKHMHPVVDFHLVIHMRSFAQTMIAAADLLESSD